MAEGAWSPVRLGCRVGATNQRFEERSELRIVGKIAQALAALGILNVWLVRFNRQTEFRGGSAENLPEEFEVYGLPHWMVYTTGAAKISLALALLAGLREPRLTRPAASALAVLMAGAIAAHVKVGDAPKKSAPAAGILVLSATAAIAARPDAASDSD